MIKYNEKKEIFQEVGFEREEEYNSAKKDAKAIEKITENNKN